MFWDDKQSGFDFALPPVPVTGWRPPEEFPRIHDAKTIAIDVETYDPHLTTKGPGWPRRDGHIVGVSLAAGSSRWYLPIRHERDADQNFPPDAVFAYLRDLLSVPGRYVVGANLLYDLGWLRAEGVRAEGRFIDIQFAGALLSENDSVALEDLARKYLDEGKESPALYNWILGAYKPAGDPRSEIYRAPLALVGPYAEADADLPLRIAPRIWEELSAEGLAPVFSMECRLIPLLLDMTEKGVRVDLEAAETVQKRLNAALKEARPEGVDIYSADSVAKKFDELDLKYPHTATGAPSFVREWLEGHPHPFAQQIALARKLDRLESTFVNGFILQGHCNGRIHCHLHPLREKERGTRSGRLSASNPNLQQIPSRDPVYGPLVRSIFIPEDGEQWAKFDYSQIEYRFLAHFARGEGAEELRAAYNGAGRVDYHKKVHSLILEKTGKDFPRGHVKNVNFGGLYGMGEGKTAKQLGLSAKASREFLKTYHEAAPYVKATMKFYNDEAQKKGKIHTIMGRISRFDFWEPEHGEGKPTRDQTEALQNWGKIKRAFTFRALNRVLQGSAADAMKQAMVTAYEEGIFKRTGTPLLTVHDELDFSAAKTCKNDLNELKSVMESALKINVPIVCDEERGPNWGQVKEV